MEPGWGIPPWWLDLFFFSLVNRICDPLALATYLTNVSKQLLGRNGFSVTIDSFWIHICKLWERPVSSSWMHQLFCLLLIQFKLLWPEWQMQFSIIWKRHIACLLMLVNPCIATVIKLLYIFNIALLIVNHFLLDGVVFLERSDYCSAFCPSSGKLELMSTLEAGN